MVCWLDKMRARAAGALVLALLMLPAATPPVPAATPTQEGVAPAAEEAPAVPASASEAAPDDPALTPPGAVRLFMTWRDYRTIRELKSVMTPALVARFDSDSAPFNGKQGTRLAAFEFAEAEFRPRIAATPGAAEAGRGASPARRPSSHTVQVKSLWEDQGEAVEMRVERLGVARQEDGRFRIGAMERVESEHWRFRGTAPGVTTVRMLLRAWDRGRLAAARRHFTPAFLTRPEGREDALGDLIVGPPDPQHLAYRIVEMQERGEDAATAVVLLYVGSVGRPTPIEGTTHTLDLAKIGSRWLVDAWK